MMEQASPWLRQWQKNVHHMLIEQDPQLNTREHFHPYPEGGESLGLRCHQGQYFEKIGISFSHIRGQALPASASEKRPELARRPFEVSGVSIVIHPLNPNIPATHANLRCFEVDQKITWFGGGFDLTPYIGCNEDARLWHQGAKQAADVLSEDAYLKHKKACDDYFDLPHRNEKRGIGGLFFDDLTSDASWPYIQAVGHAFISGYLELIERNKHTPYDQEDYDFMCYRRGRYAEFNLLYDRGTRFGLESLAPADAVLMSMPPTTTWLASPNENFLAREAKLIENFLTPKDWLNQS